MRLLVVRHAIAADLADGPYENDADRPLTAKGRRRMKAAARGLRRLVPAVDAIWTSPYVRAVATAAIVAEARSGTPIPGTAPELAPGQPPDAVLRRLRALDPGATVCLVGHEPGCSRLVATLLDGRAEARLEMGKGGAALVDVEIGPRTARGTLLWLATPRMLRRAA